MTKAERIFNQLKDLAVIKNVKNGKVTAEFNFTDGEPDTLADIESINKEAEMRLNSARW